MFWGRRKRIKSVQHQKKEHFSESERKALLLFFLYYFALKKKAEEAEGRGQRVFSSVFLRFFCKELLSLLSLSSFLFSLSFLSSSLFVFLLENSLHTK